MLEKIIKCFFIVVVVVAVIIAMRMSYNDELLMQKGYCESVADGTHPNYDNRNCDGE